MKQPPRILQYKVMAISPANFLTYPTALSFIFTYSVGIVSAFCSIIDIDRSVIALHIFA